MEAASPPSAPLGIYPEGSRRIMRSSSSASEESPHGFPPRLPHFTPPTPAACRAPVSHALTDTLILWAWEEPP